MSAVICIKLIWCFVTDANDYMESGISSIVGGLHATIPSSRDLISHKKDIENHELFGHYNTCPQNHIDAKEIKQSPEHSTPDTPSISSYDTAPTVIDYVVETDKIQANNVQI